jgi:nucleoside phosphorylase
MVDMESSAFMAVARYYGFPFAQLLYAGDDLTSEEWNSRSWHTRTGIREQLFWIAATAAWRLEALA